MGNHIANDDSCFAFNPGTQKDCEQAKLREKSLKHCHAACVAELV